MLEKQQETNADELNIIRSTLKTIKTIDKEHFYWGYVDNVYTYGHRIEKNEFYYNILLRAFRELLLSLKRQDYGRVYDLVDAFHNIPVFVADQSKKIKKLIKMQFNSYNKKYKTDLWKELTK